MPSKIKTAGKGGFSDLSAATRRAVFSFCVLIALFAADAVYSHFHPNAGEGITDYNDWQADGADAEAAASLTASNAPIRG